MWAGRPRSFRGPWLKPAATDSGVAGLGRFTSGCSHLLLMHESFTRQGTSENLPLIVESLKTNLYSV